MASRRLGAVQDELWIASSAWVRPAGHRFYAELNALNELLAEAGFDKLVEDLCLPFFAGGEERGRPSIAPGMYFRILFVGYFEEIESERDLEWRCAESLMKSIVRKDTGDDYATYLIKLCIEVGILNPTVEDAIRVDRSRKSKKTSNQDWA